MCLNNDSNDVFGMMLMYDKADSALRNRMRYDGKPSGVRWMTRNYHNTRTEERSYLYFYDGFNRYTAEGYAERDSAQVGNSAYSINRGAFNEIVSYDAGGNISKLSRYMTNPGGGSRQQIDTLTYTYSSTNPYQLQSVADGTDTWHTGYGFRNLTDSTGNYTYDGNGNLYNDHYKGMELRYNVLNRTDKITITTASSTHIDYTYDSGGNLIRKQEYNGSSTPVTTTDYIDGFVYLTSGGGTAALSYFPMPEGRVLDSLNTFTQEFIITDPQGNARVAFRKVGTTTPRAKVWQENSYYGTGFIMPNSPVPSPTVPNKKLYNGGSEWQNDYGNLPDYYQTFNRNYDAAIGRFIGVDPAGESAASLTSYQYAGNNPIISNDPAGDRFDPNPPKFNPAINEFNQGGNGDYITGNEFDYIGLVSGLSDDDDLGDVGSGALTDPAGSLGDDSSTAGNNYESIAVGPELADTNGLATIIHLYNGKTLNVQDGSNAEFDEDVLGQLTPVSYFDLDLLAGKSDQTVSNFNAGYYNGMSGIVSDIVDVSSTQIAKANQGEECPTCLVPGTGGRNLFHTNYTGQNNPLSYNGEENYSLPPTNKSDAISMGHDLGYDRYKAVGPNSVLMDTRTIGLDYTFISGQINLATGFTGEDATPDERFQGAVSGTYMFISTLPKTILQGLYYIGDALSTIKN